MNYGRVLHCCEIGAGAVELLLMLVLKQEERLQLRLAQQYVLKPMLRLKQVPGLVMKQILKQKTKWVVRLEGLSDKKNISHINPPKLW